MNIRQKLIWLPGIVLLLVVALALGLFSLYVASEKLENMIETMQDEALLLSHLGYIHENDHSPIVRRERFHAVAQELDDLHSACVYHANQLTQQWSREHGKQSCPPAAQLHRTRQLSTAFWDWVLTLREYITNESLESHNIHFEPGKIVRSGPVKDIDGHEVWVHMEYRLNDLEEMAAEMGVHILKILLITVALIVAGGTIMYRAVVRPLQRMEETARTIANQRDFAHRLSEVGELGEFNDVNRAFNHMFDEIESMQRELVTARQRAESANRHKSEFMANVTHKISTPLKKIRNFAALGMEECGHGKHPAAYEHFTDIERSASRLNQLVVDLIEFSKFTENKIAVIYDTISLATLVNEATKLMQVLCEKKDIEIILTESDAPMPWLHVDHLRMIQVLTNLLTNAIRFSPQGGIIAIDHAPAVLPDGAAGVAITMTDQGTGIPANELELIFEHFFKGSNNTHAEGSGLGLAICRRIIAAFGGTITAKNIPGSGALFEIILPAAEAPTEAKKGE